LPLSLLCIPPPSIYFTRRTVSFELQSILKMPIQQSESRRRNVTTTIRRRRASPNPPVVISEHRTTTVGRRSAKSTISVRPSSAHLTPSTSASASPAPSAISAYSQEIYPQTIEWDLPVSHPSDILPSSSTRKRKPTANVKPMNTWIPLIQSFLDEIVRRDGPGSHSVDGPCHSCNNTTPLFRCNECFSNALLCKSCILNAHQQTPFHRIQVGPLLYNSFTQCSHRLQEWNGLYFKQTSLCALGQRIQLGHDGSACPSPNIASSLSTILHTNGIHSVYIDHCACSQAVNVNITSQFLRLGLWPATVLDPKTATTIHMLEFFHQLTLQSKINFYDFYWSLSHLTSNTNASAVPVRFLPLYFPLPPLLTLPPLASIQRIQQMCPSVQTHHAHQTQWSSSLPPSALCLTLWLMRHRMSLLPTPRPQHS
jgi:hypothetical protein